MRLKFLFLFCLLYNITLVLNAQRSLSDFIDSAQRNSPIIKDNQNQSKANQLEIERLKAQFTKPQVGITGNYLFAPILSTDNNTTKIELNSKGAQNYYGQDLGLTNGGQYQGLVTVTIPLFYQERYKAYEEQAQVASLANQNNIKLAIHDIEKLVIDQYILCLLDLQQTKYVNVLNLLEQQRVIVQKLVSSALLKQSDLSLLNIEYNNFKNQLIVSNANYRRNLMDLNILAGIRDTSLVELDSLVLTPRADAFSNNSQYLERFRLDSLNLAATQKIFETRYKPQVNVFANSGLNAANISTLPRRFGIGAGVSVTWNFFDGNQKAITRKKTNILLQSVAAYRDNFLAVNDVRKNKFITELESYKERAALTQQQLNEYQLVIYSYRRELLSGQQSVINFINTIRNMGMIQRDYLLLQTNQLLLINAYNYWNW